MLQIAPGDEITADQLRPPFGHPGNPDFKIWVPGPSLIKFNYTDCTWRRKSLPISCDHLWALRKSGFQDLGAGSAPYQIQYYRSHLETRSPPISCNGTRRERLGHMTLRDDNCRHAGPGQTISQVARVDQMCEGCQTDTRSGSTTRSRNHAANAQNEIISVERREGATGPATAR